MQPGSFKQKASPLLVLFVFGCIIITTGLLYIMQKSVAIGNNYSTASGITSVEN